MSWTLTQFDHVVQNLSQILKDLGLSIDRTATELDVSPTSLLTWKGGICVPKYDNLRKIEALLTEYGYKPPKDGLSKWTLDHAIEEVAKLQNHRTQDLADGLGMSRQVIYNWFHKGTQPRLSTLIEIEKYINSLGKPRKEREPITIQQLAHMTRGVVSTAERYGATLREVKVKRSDPTLMTVEEALATFEKLAKLGYEPAPRLGGKWTAEDAMLLNVRGLLKRYGMSPSDIGLPREGEVPVTCLAHLEKLIEKRKRQQQPDVEGKSAQKAAA